MTIRSFLIAAGLAIGLAFLARHLIISEVIPWDVSDGEGHGPDRGGNEWLSALTHQATRFSIWLGISLLLAIPCLFVVIGRFRARDANKIT